MLVVCQYDGGVLHHQASQLLLTSFAMLLTKTSLLIAAQCLVSSTLATAIGSANLLSRRDDVIAPKVVIISMFSPEAEIWYGIDEFDLLAQNITVPGLSPLFPDVHCTVGGDVCQIITGESEVTSTSPAILLEGAIILT